MSPRIEGHAGVAITATRGLPVPTKPVGYAKRTPVRSGHVPIKCGTAEGYERHRELGYRPCLMCIKAVEEKTERPAKKRRSDKPIPHGTPSGYDRCRKTIGGACDDCKKAQREYHRDYQRRRREAMNGPSAGLPEPSFDVAECARLREEGWKVADLEKKYGVSGHTIRRQLNRAGVAVRDTPQTIDLDRLRELHGTGLTVARIAAEMGCTSSAVHKWMKRLDLPPNHRGGGVAKPIAHGTYGGYRAESRRKVKHCQPCRDAREAYKRKAAS